MLIQITHCSCKYISRLYKLYLKYEWPQVLEYHFKFHNCHMVEMQEGIYVGWEHVDTDLMSVHLLATPSHGLPSQVHSQPGWGPKTCQSNSATHSPMENVHHPASWEGYTNATSATCWITGLALAQKLTRKLTRKPQDN